MKRLISKLYFEIIFVVVISTLISFIIISFIPIKDKYELSVVNTFRKLPNENIAYYDLDNDNKSEELIFRSGADNNCNLIIKSDGKIITQKNFYGTFAPNFFYNIHDYNKDSYKDIFLISNTKDSIYLNVFDGKTFNSLLLNFAISQYIPYKNNIRDYSVEDFNIDDIDDNGEDDILISLYCGFSLKTRKLLKISIKDKSIVSSPTSGTIITKQILKDIDGDGKKEILGLTPSFGNYPDNSIEYGDLDSWFFVYDSDLNFKFPPIKLGEYPSTSYSQLLKSGNIALFYNNYGSTDSSFIAIYNNKGIELRRTIPKGYNSEYSKLIYNENTDLLGLYYGNGKIEIYNEQLRIVYKNKSVANAIHIGDYDIDMDGKNEHIYAKSDKDKLYVLSHDYKYNCSTVIGNIFVQPLFSSIRNIDNSYTLVADIDKDIYYLSYKEIKIYSYRYIIWLAIYLSVLSIVYVISRLYSRIIAQRYDDEKRIAVLQVSSIEKQITPAFTLKTLNAIGYLYENHEIEKAQYYFSRYSKLLHHILLHSNELTVLLEDELLYVENYLELEMFRTNNSFTYSINRNNINTSIIIPKFIIHYFIENSIQNTISASQKINNAFIDININNLKSAIEIIIKDNSGNIQNEDNRLKLNNTIDEILNIHNKLGIVKAKFFYEDNIIDNKPVGSIIKIHISK